MRGSQQVEGNNCLGDKFVPEMEGKGGINGAESGDEMVLEGLDGPLCFVASMKARWGKLEVDVVVVYFVYEGLRGFIVESL